MAGKKISELTAKVPVTTDVLAVADPSTGIAGKSTTNQIIASASGFASSPLTSTDYIPKANSTQPYVASKTRAYNIAYVGLNSWSKLTTYGSFAFQPYTYNMTGNTNNFQIGVSGLVKINCTVNSDLTGMVSENVQANDAITPGGSVTAALDGQIVYLLNTGTNAVSIKNEDALSTAVNRFLTHTGNQINLSVGHIVMALYDTGISRWRVWNLT